MQGNHTQKDDKGFDGDSVQSRFRSAEVAKNYERKRSRSRVWREENELLESMLGDAYTILDVPVGTGRFLKLYEGRDYFGMDTSEVMMREAVENGWPEERLIHAGALEISSRVQSHMDLVVCIRLLTHYGAEACRDILEEIGMVTDRAIISVNMSSNKGKMPYKTPEEWLYMNQGWTVTQMHSITPTYYMVELQK